MFEVAEVGTLDIYSAVGVCFDLRARSQVGSYSVKVAGPLADLGLY